MLLNLSSSGFTDLHTSCLSDFPTFGLVMETFRHSILPAPAPVLQNQFLFIAKPQKMTAEKILQSDILDIIFEGRNKLYGAYELRRTYHHRLKHGIGGMFLVVAIAVVSYLFGNNPNLNLSNTLVISDSITIADLTHPETPPELPPPPPPSRPPEAAIAYTVPLIVANLPETEVARQTDIDTSAIGITTTPGIASTGQVIPDMAPGTPGGDGPLSEPASNPASTLPAGPIDMGKVDQVPEYPGGSRALVNYMVRNLTSELEPGVKYVVKAQFIINDEGAVSDAVILHSDDETLNNQVLKAIRKMVRWKPGVLNGQKVAVRFTMPVTFVGPEE